ncbi:hypothetical protein L2E82_29454 [Cichorium intybus]|uniref:Uncharacterized protein n=1 Tax=Cichorium intybus TaxID=13427 RepID=A0ACB9CXX3_CICIN|nr:hypothetical protein L2E82_29454 [Cichorium intybus]
MSPALSHLLHFWPLIECLSRCQARASTCPLLSRYMPEVGLCWLCLSSLAYKILETWVLEAGSLENWDGAFFVSQRR